MTTSDRCRVRLLLLLRLPTRPLLPRRWTSALLNNTPAVHHVDMQTDYSLQLLTRYFTSRRTMTELTLCVRPSVRPVCPLSAAVRLELALSSVVGTPAILTYSS